MCKIRIIPLLPEHQDFLWDMLYESLYVAEGQKPYKRKIIYQSNLSKYAENWGKEKDIGVIAIDNNTNNKIAAAWLRLFKGKNKGYGHVDDACPELAIAVLKPFRRQGIGSLLISELIAEATSLFQAISLSVLIENPAINLYKKSGFVSIKQIDKSYVMLKKLKSMKKIKYSE